MKRVAGLLSAFAIGLTAVGYSQSAQAKEIYPDFSLHLDPALVVPLTAPQSDIYNPGPGMGAKLLFNLNHWLTLGPSLSSFYLPKSVDDGSNAGVFWQFGGSARVQGTFTVDGAPLRPWLDVDLSAGHTGVLWLPTGDVGAGIEVALNDAKSVWFGPFVRYQHTFQTSNAQDGMVLDKRDPNMLWVGGELSFDFPVRPTEHVVVRDTHCSHNDPVFIIQRVVVHDTTPAPEKVELGKVYFNWDSPKLRSWEETDKIDHLIAVLKAHPEAHVRVEGNASSDGQRAHNITLSSHRTAAVVNYLIAHGVDASRVDGIALGVDHPSHTNATQEGRERNRRVEFVVNYTAEDAPAHR